MASPLSVTYATFVDPNSDKFYEVRVDTDNGVTNLTKRWGRNPDNGKGGQSKVETYPSVQAAKDAARTVMDQKVRTGYSVIAWPFGSTAMPDFRNIAEVEAWLAQ